MDYKLQSPGSNNCTNNVNLATFDTTGVLIDRVTTQRRTIPLTGGNLTSIAGNTTLISLVAEDSIKLRSANPNPANVSLILTENTISDSTGLSKAMPI